MVIIDALVVVSFILLVILLVRVSRLVQAVDALSEKFCEPVVDNSDIAASAPIAVPASMSAPTPAVPSASTPEPVLAAAPVPMPGLVAAWAPAPMAQGAPAARMREFDDAALDPAPAVRAPGSGRDVESWIGRNALGVMASVLVFLGLVFLGVTFVPQWPDWVKVASMFALSCVLVGVGGVLSWRHKNGFTSALMGCGAGSLFISVFLTHLYFGMLGEVQAYALLLGWMALCLALALCADAPAM